MDSSEKTSTRQSAINGLAVVGFVALVAAGISLAVYSTRFVPTVVNSAGAAAVYLGSFFTPNSEPGISVVPTPTASSTIFFGEASSTISTKETITTPLPTPLKKITTIAGGETSGAYEINNATGTPKLSGLPDLVVNINAIGYLGTASGGSFVASSTVPSGFRPAVRFTIKNIGTNIAGVWRFSASIPTQTAYVYQSQPQQALNPGDSIEYTLGFDQATNGADKMISITANFDHAISESNTNNNSASTKVTIIGS